MRGDGGYLVGRPSFELDVRREKERGRRGGGDQNVAVQIEDGEITTELRRLMVEKEERRGKAGRGEDAERLTSSCAPPSPSDAQD